MRRLIILSSIILVILVFVLHASASLVGTAGPFMGQAPSPTPVPGPSPRPAPIETTNDYLSGVVPVTTTDNTVSQVVPAVNTIGTALDTGDLATLNNAMTNMALSPVQGGDLSPFEDIRSLGGASVGVQPIDNILNSIMSTIPPGNMISDEMNWF